MMPATRAMLAITTLAALAHAGCCFGMPTGGTPPPPPMPYAPPVAPAAPVPSLPPATGAIVLWCSQAQGAACLAATTALGVAPVQAGAIPMELLTATHDLEDDCADPDLAGMLARLAPAMGISPGNWHDNTGTLGEAQYVSDVYSGGGCTNCCWSETEPPIKVQVAPSPAGLRYLVRVWERGEIPE